MATESEIAWAAGLFEGEGSFTRSAKSFVLMSLRMTDRDVVEHFAQVVGIGNVYSVHDERERKPLFSWQLGAQTEVKRITKMFWPWLHERRQEQYIKAFLGWWEYRKPELPNPHPSPFCSKGHEEWSYSSGRRKCLPCHRISGKRYRDRKAKR